MVLCFSSCLVRFFLIFFWDQCPYSRPIRPLCVCGIFVLYPASESHCPSTLKSNPQSNLIPFSRNIWANLFCWQPSCQWQFFVFCLGFTKNKLHLSVDDDAFALSMISGGFMKALPKNGLYWKPGLVQFPILHYFLVHMLHFSNNFFVLSYFFHLAKTWSGP